MDKPHKPPNSGVPEGAPMAWVAPPARKAAIKQRTQAGLPTSRFMVIDTQRESIHLFRSRNPFGAMPGLQQPPEKQKLTSHSAPGNIAFAIHAHRRPSCRFMPQELLPALSLEKGKKAHSPKTLGAPRVSLLTASCFHKR